MNNKKKNTLINILVIGLYFIWPYFLYLFTSLFKLSNITHLYISFSVNFIFLFIIIYIYRDILNKYYNNFKKDFKKNIFNSIKIFLLGIGLYVLFNILLSILNVPLLSGTKEIFSQIPVIFVLNTLFYYPVIEELVFKMSFKEIFKSKWSFIVFTGIFNALFQIVFSFSNITDLLYLLPCVCLFSSLSYIYYKTDNIMYPILLRICYNLIPCIIYLRNLLY